MRRAGGGPTAPGGWPTGQRLREFEEFDRTYRPIALEYLRSLDGTVPYLDEAVQDALKAVAWRWEEVRDYDRPKAYLFMVARQRWLKYRQYRGNRAATLPNDLDGALAPRPGDPDGDPAPHVHAARDTLALLRLLPTRQREVTFLRYVAGFDEESTAEVLGISVGSVKRHRARALEKLRQINYVQVGMPEAHREGGSK